MVHSIGPANTQGAPCSPHEKPASPLQRALTIKRLQLNQTSNQQPSQILSHTLTTEISELEQSSAQNSFSALSEVCTAAQEVSKQIGAISVRQGNVEQVDSAMQKYLLAAKRHSAHTIYDQPLQLAEQQLAQSLIWAKRRIRLEGLFLSLIHGGNPLARQKTLIQALSTHLLSLKTTPPKQSLVQFMLQVLFDRIRFGTPTTIIERLQNLEKETALLIQKAASKGNSAKRNRLIRHYQEQTQRLKGSFERLSSNTFCIEQVGLFYALLSTHEQRLHTIEELCSTTYQTLFDQIDAISKQLLSSSQNACELGTTIESFQQLKKAFSSIAPSRAQSLVEFRIQEIQSNLERKIDTVSQEEELAAHALWQRGEMSESASSFLSKSMLQLLYDHQAPLQAFVDGCLKRTAPNQSLQALEELYQKGILTSSAWQSAINTAIQLSQEYQNLLSTPLDLVSAKRFVEIHQCIACFYKDCTEETRPISTVFMQEIEHAKRTHFPQLPTCAEEDHTLAALIIHAMYHPDQEISQKRSEEAEKTLTHLREMRSPVLKNEGLHDILDAFQHYTLDEYRAVYLKGHPQEISSLKEAKGYFIALLSSEKLQSIHDQIGSVFNQLHAPCELLSEILALGNALYTLKQIDLNSLEDSIAKRLMSSDLEMAKASLQNRISKLTISDKERIAAHTLWQTGKSSAESYTFLAKSMLTLIYDAQASAETRVFVDGCLQRTSFDLPPVKALYQEAFPNEQWEQSIRTAIQLTDEYHKHLSASPAAFIRTNQKLALLCEETTPITAVLMREIEEIRKRAFLQKATEPQTPENRRRAFKCREDESIASLIIQAMYHPDERKAALAAKSAHLFLSNPRQSLPEDNEFRFVLKTFRQYTLDHYGKSHRKTLSSLEEAKKSFLAFKKDLPRWIHPVFDEAPFSIIPSSPEQSNKGNDLLLRAIQERWTALKNSTVPLTWQNLALLIDELSSLHKQTNVCETTRVEQIQREITERVSEQSLLTKNKRLLAEDIDGPQAKGCIFECSDREKAIERIHNILGPLLVEACLRISTYKSISIVSIVKKTLSSSVSKAITESPCLCALIAHYAHSLLETTDNELSPLIEQIAGQPELAAYFAQKVPREQLFARIESTSHNPLSNFIKNPPPYNVEIWETLYAQLASSAKTIDDAFHTRPFFTHLSEASIQEYFASILATPPYQEMRDRLVFQAECDGEVETFDAYCRAVASYKQREQELLDLLPPNPPFIRKEAIPSSVEQAFGKLFERHASFSESRALIEIGRKRIEDYISELAKDGNTKEKQRRLLSNFYHEDIASLFPNELPEDVQKRVISEILNVEQEQSSVEQAHKQLLSHPNPTLDDVVHYTQRVERQYLRCLIEFSGKRFVSDEVIRCRIESPLFSFSSLDSLQTNTDFFRKTLTHIKQTFHTPLTLRPKINASDTKMREALCEYVATLQGRLEFLKANQGTTNRALQKAICSLEKHQKRLPHSDASLPQQCQHIQASTTLTQKTIGRYVCSKEFEAYLQELSNIIHALKKTPDTSLAVIVKQSLIPFQGLIIQLLQSSLHDRKRLIQLYENIEAITSDFNQCF